MDLFSNKHMLMCLMALNEIRSNCFESCGLFYEVILLTSLLSEPFDFSSSKTRQTGKVWRALGSLRV